MKNSARGFTLVELLIVIAIIAILAAIAILIVNPIEIMKRTRDASRMADMSSLQSAINVAVQEAADPAALLCATSSGGSSANPAGYCSGKSTDGDATKADADGWVKVNLAGQTSVSVPALPTDPGNNATYHYLYCGYVLAGATPAWEINAVLESTTYGDKMGTDGGDSTTKYEVGSNLKTIPAADNCQY